MWSKLVVNMDNLSISRVALEEEFQDLGEDH